MDLSSILNDIPLSSPPPGVTSNFDNPQSLSDAIIIVGAILTTFMTLVVIARLYVRGTIVRKLWWDDYLIIVAALACIAGFTTLTYAAKNYGYGRHSWDIRLSTVTTVAFRVTASVVIIYTAAMCLAKISIAAMYIKLFGVDRNFRYCIYAFIVFCLGTYGAAFCYQSVQLSICLEPKYRTSNLCAVFGPLQLGLSILNLTTDFFLVIAPALMIAKLNMARKQKAGLMVSFACGSLACLASLARLIYIGMITHVLSGADSDTLWEGAVVVIVSLMEINLGVIGASCVPTRRILETPLFKHLTSRYHQFKSHISSSSSLGSSSSSSRTTRQRSHSNYKSTLNSSDPSNDTDVSITLLSIQPKGASISEQGDQTSRRGSRLSSVGGGGGQGRYSYGGEYGDSSDADADAEEMKDVIGRPALVHI